MSQTFDSIEPGDELPPSEVVLERAFVTGYARFLDIAFARFTDEEGAKREGLPGQITPGVLSLALLARTLLSWAPGAQLRRLGTTFRGVALAGSTVTIQGTVTEKDEAARTIECDLWMESAEGDRLVIGTATLALP